MRRLTSVLSLIALAGAGCTAKSTDQSVGGDPSTLVEPNTVTVQFEVLDEVHRSQVSGIRSPRRTIIRSEADWEDFWSEFASVVVPRPDAPRVDFANHMVIVAAMGQRPTGGYSIEITEVSRGDAGLAVRVAEGSPAVGCLLTQVLTTPATAVVVPRHEGDVTFEEQSTALSCG